ncbi:MAG: OmpA family protein [Flavobacteriales bacterium]|nr:OmpA family protein [Flavobacteriales bacterium]
MMFEIKCILLQVFVVFLSCRAGVAQDNNSDCENAVQISETYAITHIPMSGFGETQEMSGTDDEKQYYFSKEVNSSWYQFVVPYEAMLMVEIEPKNKESDIDFLLFQSQDANTCERIKSKEIKPVRSNVARNEGKYKGKTGLSKKGTAEFVPPGPGNSYSLPLEVKRGNEYFLILNNLTGDKLGHTITLKYLTKESILEDIPSYTTNSTQATSKTIDKADAGISLTVNVEDSKEGKPIDVTLEIDGIIPGEPLIVEHRHHFTYILEKGKRYLVKCIYEGFMLYSKEIIAPETAEKIDLNIVLDPIEVGSKVALHNIKFKPNGAHILNSSEAELQVLVKFMDKNPTMIVKINGHVNAPKMKNTSEIHKMSRDRAKAVYVYLIEHGVSKRRLKFEGYGNEQMIYPVPITHDQERMNRRVEIEILKS